MIQAPCPILPDTPANETHPKDALFLAASQCSRFQELRHSSPGLAACLLWLEDWECLPAEGIGEHLAFLAALKRRAICLRYGFPASRALLRLFENWEKGGDILAEKLKSHNCLLELRKLLQCETEALKLLEHSSKPSLAEVQRLIYGRITAPLGFFPRTWLLRGRCDWFFQLPTLSRHHLAGAWCDLLRRDSIEGCVLPPLLLLCHFPNEKKARAYIQRRNFLLDHIAAWVVEIFGSSYPEIDPLAVHRELHRRLQVLHGKPAL